MYSCVLKLTWLVSDSCTVQSSMQQGMHHAYMFVQLYPSPLNALCHTLPCASHTHNQCQHCRLGADWSDKKSICNKFLQSSPVTCISWPPQRHNEVVFGLSDGKVKLGILKSNKTYNMYGHPDSSYVVSLAANSTGSCVISGHLDGSIYKFTFPEQEGSQGLGHAKLLQHSCTPYALAWSEVICAAGNDCRVRKVAAIAHAHVMRGSTAC